MRFYRSAAIASVLLTVNMSIAAEPAMQPLTFDGRLKYTPFFRHGGKEVIFAEFVDPTLFQLRRLPLEDANSGDSVPLHEDGKTSEFEPAWSADDECYAYLKTRGVLSISIVVRNRQGTQLNEILPDEGFCGYRSPALAPDHSRIAFSYADKGSQQIYSAKLNGDDRKLLTPWPGVSNWPCYSPDGRSLVFSSSKDGNYEIHRMDVDGTNVQRLTDSPLQDIRPRVSPDGARIAFTSHRDGNAEIYVMQADGSKVMRVTENPERDDYPDWHPDGKRLIIVSERRGKHDLYIVHLPE